ncbi:NAD(P)/FAD-dependent oxidoreductase [Candidatus Uhrbacteria bacterium]|nr:NAD(P)/FAD-dependent oxidoreductase [Candidatus Uhrbacteria bacterium]
MRIAIVGGGAAGLMCAATLAESGVANDVVLLEKNAELGKKVLISGGGRCNVTTGLSDVRQLLLRYPRGQKFLQKAMYHFPPLAVRDWFESHGVPLKVEKDLRVFPVSDNGSDIVGVFKRLFDQANVQILYGHQVISISESQHVFTLHLKQTISLEVDAVVLTTGGQAYRHTGSTGDGYTFAEKLGHTITPLAPSLSAFIVEEHWPKTLAGVSVKNATITCGNKRFTGPFLFTHKGITGPAVFALSALIAFETCTPQKKLHMEINLFPDRQADVFVKELHELAQSHGKKNLLNIISTIIPYSIAEICLGENYINANQHGASLSKEQAQNVVHWLQHIPITVISRVAGDEFVTAGGVNTKDVDPKTMESLLVPGLYFAGEILDIDGFTGGFNLQASWATGRLAGEAIISTSNHILHNT